MRYYYYSTSRWRPSSLAAGQVLMDSRSGHLHLPVSKDQDQCIFLLNLIVYFKNRNLIMSFFHLVKTLYNTLKILHYFQTKVKPVLTFRKKIVHRGIVYIQIRRDILQEYMHFSWDWMLSPSVLDQLSVTIAYENNNNH